jgi:hypothetical protein
VTLATLRQFLEDPLQGSARFRLRLRDVEGDDELADRDAEPFELRRHERAETLREALIAELTAEGDGPPRRDDVIARWNDVRERRLLDGRAPAGLFSRAERPLDEEMLAAWWRQLGDASGTGTPPRGRVYRFGRAAAREPAREIHPAIVLDPDEAHGRRIELAGRTELVVAPAPGARASVVLFARTPKSRRPPARELLRAFLDHVALAAAGFDGEAHGAWLVNAEGKPGAAERPAFAPVDRGRARRYLAELTAELLAGSAADATGAPTGVHAYLLPCEAVFAAREREAGDVVDVVEELRDGYLDFPRANGFSSAWGPVPQAVERHHPPSLDAAARMVEARFGLLFELLESGAAAPTGARRRA